MAITTGIGLISGLDYQSIVDQLIAIEARPRDQVLTRIGSVNAQKTAYLDISARITALLTRINTLVRPSAFTAAKVTSSSPDVLSATVTAGAQPGSYSVLVRALAATHQVVSRGFASRTAPLSSGTLTIESAQARVNNSTPLADLNGHAGVRRGSFKIINEAGQEAVINLDEALTVGEVLNQINANSVDVRAAVRGDTLVLTDSSGGTGNLRVLEVNAGSTAADLGFGLGHMTGTDGELVGSDVVYLSSTSSLNALNDGLGVRRSEAGGDFEVDVGGSTFSVDLSDVLKPATRLERLNHGQGVRLGRIKITSRDRSSTEIDLTGAKTIGEVKSAIENAFGGGRISVVLTGNQLNIADNTDISDLESDQIGDFAIADVTGHAAQDLGIRAASSQGQVTGADVLYVETIQDILHAVNYAAGNEGADKLPLLVASLGTDGNGLVFKTGSGSFTLRIPAAAGSQALADLGLVEGTYYDMGEGAEADGRRVVSGLDTVLLKTLNGGKGFPGTTLQITANGRTATLNMAGAETLADVIDRINAATDTGGQSLGIQAGYDATGTRLVVSNVTDATDITMGGDFAAPLGLAQTGVTLKSNNLQRQYISETTRLDDLNGGRGVSRGRIKLTARNGVSGTVDLASVSIATLQDVINEIHALQLGVTARINETGDGLLITDSTTGSGALRIEEDGGKAAHDLNILGDSATGQIDGSLEFHLDVSGNDTLDTLASRIGAETALATASVLNDGTGGSPHRLTISSLASGARGELILDDGTGALALATLSRAQDARVFLGGSGGGGLLLTNSSNTFDHVINGLSFTVSGVDDQAVNIQVERNVDSLVEALSGLVEDFNSALDRVREAGAYDADTEQLGILQGDSTLNMIQGRLRRMFDTSVAAGPAFQRLSEVGLTYESGSRLGFDEEKFRAAFAADPEGVQTLFTDEDHGVAFAIQSQIEAITDSDGLIDQRAQSLDDRKTLLEDRVEQMNDQLERKRARLLKQFQAMETALAQLQAQQQSLASFTSIASSFFSSSGSSTTS